MLKVEAYTIAVVLLSAQVTWAQSADLPSDLPSGPTQAKVTTACTECHESRIIVQQRLSKPAWTKEVDKMVKWGALVDPAEHDGFVDYLSTNFSGERPVYVAPKTATEKK
jgi:hypothetical protein